MTRDEIQRSIPANLEQSGIAAEDVRVQLDPYGGWRIAVIANGFAGKSSRERRSVCLAGLDEIEIEWIDLLTPEEREWAGPLPGDVEPDQLPLWPESLARGNLEIPPVRFPSDLDEDLSPPFVVTFYSLRGGVGRSTALAYAARILASRGRKVVCVDMDLEAPGLAALFGREADVGSEQGVLALLLQIDQEGEPDFASHLLRIDDREELYLVPAGTPDADYARRLQLIEPPAWYREDRNPLRLLLEGLSTKLPFTPDVLLLDARTGITPLSAPLLFDLADLAVVTFFPHPQARQGTAALVRGLLAAHTHRSNGGQPLTPEPRFLVSPIPASRASEVVQRYEHRPLEWISKWLEAANQDREGLEPLVVSEITHFVRYREDVATSDRIVRDTDTWRAFEGIAEWIEQFLPIPGELRVEPSLEQEKLGVLEELSFSAGTAETQEDFLANFVETDVVREAINPEVPLVLGRKGSGKTAVFRRLSEQGGPSVVVHAPAGLTGSRKWLMSIDGFKEVERLLARADAEWRHFWTFYTCNAVANELQAGESAIPDELGGGPLARTEKEVLDSMEKVLKIDRFSILLNDWLATLDTSVSSETLLLLDGLDTGFGSAQPDRARRREAIENLFSFWMDRGAGLDKLRFKIVLREDIWRSLQFQNKSHLFGRSVTLKWQDQATYFKIILKQALASKAFTRLLRISPGSERLEPDALEIWSSEDVFTAWKLLVGERMKGSKTAFTRNWVWYRLGDANDDHTPRHLLQLFHVVVPWERKEHARSAYNRSVIRPKGLIVCLSTVSTQALEALEEEFSEIEGILDELRRVAYTPVAAEWLEKHKEALPLAREVGLLSVYEESGDQVIRYKVPEIYRWGLEMKRRGQA